MAPETPHRREMIEKDMVVEEGEIDAYMDADNHKVKDLELLVYLKRRLLEINHEYRTLIMQKIELEGSNRDQALNQIRTAFTENYKSRKYVVKKLRELGETVEDKFVAG